MKPSVSLFVNSNIPKLGTTIVEAIAEITKDSVTARFVKSVEAAVNDPNNGEEVWRQYFQKQINSVPGANQEELGQKADRILKALGQLSQTAQNGLLEREDLQNLLKPRPSLASLVPSPMGETPRFLDSAGREILKDDKIVTISKESRERNEAEVVGFREGDKPAITISVGGGRMSIPLSEICDKYPDRLTSVTAEEQDRPVHTKTKKFEVRSVEVVVGTPEVGAGGGKLRGTLLVSGWSKN